MPVAGPGGGARPPSPLFLDQTEGPKTFFWRPPPPPLLSQGLDPPLHALL